MKRIYIFVFAVILMVAAVGIILLLPSGSDETGAVVDTPFSENIETSPEKELPVCTASMDDTLFIGDSRSVGLDKYADLDEADFFAVVGMTVFQLPEAVVNIEGLGDVYLTQLLDSRQYGKVFITLGVNEAGFPMSRIIDEYGKLIDTVKEKQPYALIFVQANLLVTREFSEKSEYIKNEAVVNINNALSQFADNEKIFFIDANEIFSDGNGYLSPDCTSDGIHLFADDYRAWGEWIKQQTAMLIG